MRTPGDLDERRVPCPPHLHPTGSHPRPSLDHLEFQARELIDYFGAVRDQDLGTLRRCLDANPALTEARINDRGTDLRGEPFASALRNDPLTDRSSTAIHLAANSFPDYPPESPGRSVDLVRVLLEYGADASAVGFNENTGHCTPIVIASWEGGMEKMRLLLEAGADVSGDQGVAALRTAANHAKTDRYDLLVEYGAPSTPWLLIRAGLTDRVIDLVDEDPSLLTHRDDQGYTLLQAAAARIDRDAGDELAEAGRATAEALMERGVEADVFAAAALNDEDRLRALLQVEPIRR